ncbi:MAG: DUF4340 domain-containing protein [bacterium]
MTRYVVTAVLVLVLAGLVAYVRFYEKGELPEEGEEKEIAVFSLRKDDVARIELAYPGRKIVCDKKGGKWRIVEPERLRVDGVEMDMLLDSIVNFKASRELGETGRLEDFGLKEPSFRLVVKTAGGGGVEIEAGGEAPAGGRTYFRLAGSKKVYLAESYRISQFRKDVSDIRDKSIIRFDRDGVAEVAVEKGGTAVRCVKTKKGGWRFAGKKRACDSESSAVMSTLKYADAREFVSGAPPEKTGVENPVYVLKLKYPGNKERAILLGAREGDDLYVHNPRRGETYKISDALWNDVEEMVSAWEKKEEKKDRKKGKPERGADGDEPTD